MAQVPTLVLANNMQLTQSVSTIYSTATFDNIYKQVFKFQISDGNFRILGRGLST